MSRRKNSKSNSKKEGDYDKKPITENSKSGVEKCSPEEKREAEDKAKNDVEWYARDPQLLLDASRFTFAEPFGGRTKLTPFQGALTSNTVSVGTNCAPDYAGIFTYRVKPTLGYSNGMKDPANVAAAMLYTHVRYVNSGRKNYDPADLMMYVLSISELYSMVAFCQKIYAAAYMYSQRNLFIGKAVLDAIGIDADSLINNLANYRYWLNSFIAKISAYAIPSDLTYFNLKVQEYSGLYLENEEGNIKDQMYQVVPDGFYRFTLETNSGYGMLEYVRTPFTRIESYATKTPINYWMQYCESFLSNIWADEDFGLMSGDILKAFDNRILGLAPQQDDAMLIPVFDRLMLEKFHNARVMNVARNDIATTPPYVTGAAKFRYTNDDARVHNPGNIYQKDDGNLECREMFTPRGGTGDVFTNTYDPNAEMVEAICSNPTQIVDIKSAVADPATVVEGTRFTSVLGDLVDVEFNTTGSTWNAEKCRLILSGVEIVVGIDVTYMQTESEMSHLNWPSKMHTVCGCVPVICFTHGTGSVYPLTWNHGIQNPNPYLNIRKPLSLLQGKYCPLVFAASWDTSTGSVAYAMDDVVIVSSLANYTYTGIDELSRLHEVAKLSLLSVPGVAKMIVQA